MKNVYALILLFMYFNTNAQLVHNTTELQNAIINATAGSVIELANGTWVDVQISINVNATSTAPCIIRAETPGFVYFEGNSNISLAGSYVVFEGVIFKNAYGLVTNNGYLEPIIEFRDTKNNECVYCVVRNIKIDSYNASISQEADVFKWIILYGAYNEVSYSSFIGKNGVGSIINDNHNNSTPDYSKIHHNYFADRVPVGGDVTGLNNQDAIRIGVSSTSLSNSFTEVYDNLFYNWAGEVEIISNKCGSNKYYNNTFRDYQGTLTLRHGNNTEVFGNYFFGNNNPLSGGVRVIGENHKIYNNYFEALNYKKENGSGSNATGGINISNGKPDSELYEYYQVKNVKVVNNTFVNCDLGIRVGTKINSTLTLAPENIEIANNIMLNTSINAFQIITPSTGNSINQGNITQNGNWDLINGVNSNETVSSELLTKETDFYRILSGSPAVNAGVGNYSFVTKDVLDGYRDSKVDAGAEEFGANGTAVPYNTSDVGVKIGFGVDNPLSVKDLNLNSNVIKLFPIPSSDTLTILKEKGPIGIIKIYNIQGQLLYTENSFINTTKIDVSAFSSGVYILKTLDSTKRFVVN